MASAKELTFQHLQETAEVVLLKLLESKSEAERQSHLLTLEAIERLTTIKATAAADGIAAVSQERIPPEVPANPGAMVRTDTGTYIRRTYDAHSLQPWILANNVDETFRIDEIGRIIEVLFEGVEPA